MRGPAKFVTALLVGSLIVVAANRHEDRTAAEPPAAASRPSSTVDHDSAQPQEGRSASARVGSKRGVDPKQPAEGNQAGDKKPAGDRKPAARRKSAVKTEPASGRKAAVKTKPVAGGKQVAAKKPGRSKTVALTFDDGPSPYTPRILDILRRHRVKATFCLLGNNVGGYRKTARRIVREGHRLCNHSRDHADFTSLSRSAARANVRQAQARIRNVAGRGPRAFRFPYGASNAATRAVVRGEGLRILGWTVDTRDWQGPPASTITRRAVRNAHPGAVILMHDGGGDRSHTVASLGDTIRRLKGKGYTFVLA
ncbi:polysaccharide deacetylase family protein [Actinoplanes aureus]|uniref:Polysaccharide deacetylase family protein n=1 Tax=Actinoplanes aureus TaxID=2792083 RepID=A0A931G332_9ACTN|nr:polysaccharide deacetylase family protein [Actinoplanes aureus]MBG0568407.1 polysaccharide deacetylase family protein [Actinoplanes aureus]